jgi:hypothetical protein
LILFFKGNNRNLQNDNPYFLFKEQKLPFTIYETFLLLSRTKFLADSQTLFFRILLV